MPDTSYDVFLEEIPVGSLFRGQNGRTGFRFGEAYRELPIRPVLSQSFEDDLETVYWGRKPGELPVFFANLLPEGQLREVLEKDLHLSGGDDLDLLAAVASDLPGAVSLRSGSSLQDLPFPPDDFRPADRAPEADGLRFSLAGVQLKFSMIREDSRFTFPAKGKQGDWIVKVASKAYPGLAKNEYSVLFWARLSGFSVPQNDLVRPSDIPGLDRYVDSGEVALVVQRYDRVGGARVHQEDFCQILGRYPHGYGKYEATYAQVGRIVLALLGRPGYEEFIRRLCLVIASGNMDAHLKNWSILYPDGLRPAWTPLYDQVATVAWPDVHRRLGLKFAGSWEPREISMASFERFAKSLGADPTGTLAIVQETLSEFRATWHLVLADSPMLPAHARAVEEEWRRTPLLREVGSLCT